MKKTVAADNSGDWVRVVVDGVPYLVSRKSTEIRYEGEDPLCLHLLTKNQKHRAGLAEKASTVHRESSDGGWLAERPDSWSVHAGGKSLKVMWDGSIPSSERAAAKIEAIQVGRFGVSITAEPGEDINKIVKDLKSAFGPDSDVDYAGGSEIIVEMDARTPAEAESKVSEVLQGAGYEASKVAARHLGGSKMSKPKNLVAAALAAAKAKTKRTANTVEQLAQEKFNKPVAALTDDEVRQLLEEMKSKLPGSSQAPAAAPAAPIAPPAPGQAMASIRWMRSAEDDKKDDSKDDKKAPPFEKKDDKKDEKGDEPKSDKKDDSKDSKEPKEKEKPKKDKAPDAPKKEKKEKKEKKDSPKDTPAGDAKDAKEAEKAVEILEKLLQKEKSEGEPHAAEVAKALELVKKFLAEEKAEHGPDDHDILDSKPAPGIPVKVDLPVVGPAKPEGPAKPPMPSMAPKPAVKPISPMPMAAKEAEDAGFREGDAVWHKEASGPEFEPGRVIAIGGGKVIVDWGDQDGIPAEEDPADLVVAQARVDEGNLFAAEAGSEDAVVVDEEPLADDKSEIETILSGLSVKDLLDKKSSTGSTKGAITHIATGRAGEFLAHTSDGRCLVRLDDEETFVWPYEIKFDGETPLF